MLDEKVEILKTATAQEPESEMWPFPDKPTYTPQEYAYRWSVTVRTVYLWIENGHIQIEKTPGGIIRIPRMEMLKNRMSREVEG